MKYRTFLVTGGAGFVGSHLVDSLIERGADKVVVIDNLFLGRMENLDYARRSGNVVVYREDCRYLTAVENIIAREKPEVVFDLAVKPLPYSFVDPEGAYMTSVEIALNMVHLLKEGAYEKLVHFSSSEAYGQAVKIPMKEDHPLNPYSPYGAGKAAADLMLTSYAKMFDLDLTIIRPFNMMGPRQNMEAYAAVLPITVRRILSREPPIIEWDGDQTRDFLYVKDAVEASIDQMECEEAVGKVVNVGSGAGTKIKDLIFAVCEVMGYPTENIIYRDKRPGDVRHLEADTSLATELYGFKPKTTLRDMVQRTVNWFRSQPMYAYGRS